MLTTKAIKICSLTSHGIDKYNPMKLMIQTIIYSILLGILLATKPLSVIYQNNKVNKYTEIRINLRELVHMLKAVTTKLIKEVQAHNYKVWVKKLHNIKKEKSKYR